MKTKINTYEIENTNIGVYKNAKTTKRSDIIRLIDFLIPCQNYIKDHVLELRNIMDEKQQKEYKMNNLIGVTISALLGESRNTNNIIQHNNLMCVDVDEDDNKELFAKYNIEEIKEAIFNLDFVYCVCLSCRGKGFYFITPIPDSNDIDIYYTSMYYKLKGYGINIDKHCKDITRIRFGSYDSNILIKTDCEIEVFDEISEEQIREKRKELENAKRIIAKRNSYTRNEQLIYLEKSIKYLIYKGFDTGKHWSNWATVGKYLKTFGEYGKDLSLDQRGQRLPHLHDDRGSLQGARIDLPLLLRSHEAARSHDLPPPRRSHRRCIRQDLPVVHPAAKHQVLLLLLLHLGLVQQWTKPDPRQALV